jgi:hypothetical protein
MQNVRMKRALWVVGLSLGCLAGAVRGQDETNQVVNIWNDFIIGSPVPDGTTIDWEFDVRNNSNLLPEGGAWNENITNVRFLNLYSSSAPTAGTMPHFTWSPSFTENEDGTYNFQAGTSSSSRYLKPGQTLKYGLRTYVPSTNHVLVVGESTNAVPGERELRGQGRFQGWSWAPIDPSEPTNPDKGGDAFTGPVGTLEVLSGEGGRVEHEGRYLHEGARVEFVLISSEGYRVKGVRYAGETLEYEEEVEQAVYVVEGVGRTGRLEAEFARKEYALEVLSARGGSPHPGSVEGVLHGTSVEQGVDVVVESGETGKRYVVGGWELRER